VTPFCGGALRDCFSALAKLVEGQHSAKNIKKDVFILGFCVNQKKILEAPT
jgi:hypothetical protein